MSEARGLRTKNEIVYAIAYSFFIFGQGMLSLTKAVNFEETWQRVLYCGVTTLVLWVSEMSLILILHQLANIQEHDGQTCIQESIFLDLK